MHEFAKGLSERTVRQISCKRKEPAWLLDFRLAGLSLLGDKKPPLWSTVVHPSIDLQKMSYFAESEEGEDLFSRLHIKKGDNLVTDKVLDSVSIGGSEQLPKRLKEQGIIFSSLSDAVLFYPALVKRYLGSVISANDHYYAALNCAVFTEGSFIYIPPHIHCPIDLSTYFRIDSSDTGQFERTLIVADRYSSVRYLEGCTSPQRSQYQLHSAIVEIVALPGSEVKYCTIQNWHTGGKKGGGIYNFVTKRAVAEKEAKVTWVQVETGASITWKYPSIRLQGENSRGEFYSLAVTDNKQQADTGTKMIHSAPGSSSLIRSKSIVCGESKSTYRGLIRFDPAASNSRSNSICDSFIFSARASSFALPTIESQNDSSVSNHEAKITRKELDQLIYLYSRGLSEKEIDHLLITGYCRSIFEHLPFEFAIDAYKLLSKYSLC